MPPPPSPASSTCSDTTVPSSSQKRAKKTPTVKDGSDKSDEEEWNLKDVIFVEDSKNIPVGRVLKIDGSYAVIKFTQGHGSSTSGKDQPVKEEDVATLLQECRLLRLDDLQLVKNGTLPKSPDCIQKTPRKVHLQDLSNVLALSVDANGIQAIVRDGKKLALKCINLHTGKPEGESTFPSDITAFLGVDPSRISLNCASDNEFMNILRDGNGTVYPLVKDCLQAIKDPILVDLPPISCMGTGVHALPHVSSQQKNQVGVIVLATEQQILMSKILKCDVEGVRQALANLDHEAQAKSGTSSNLNKVLLERCDGNRNVFHTAVCMAMPTTNKDIEAAPSGISGSGSSAGGSGSFGNLDSTIENLANVLSSTSGIFLLVLCLHCAHCNKVLHYILGQNVAGVNAMLEGDDSNESTESGVTIGFRGFGSSSPGPSAQISGGPQHGQGVWDANERIRNALSIIKLMCESYALEPHLHQLLGEKYGVNDRSFASA